MEITLKPGEKARVGSFEIELADITVKRLPVNPETGKGGDEELKINLRFTKGGRTTEESLSRHYPNDAARAEFDGYAITLVEVENFQEWARFRVDPLEREAV